MTIFETLVVAHAIGDWLLQTEWQALNKATNWRALITHVLIYHLMTLLMLVFVHGLSGPPLYYAVAALAVTHAILDRQNIVIGFMKVTRLSLKEKPEHWHKIVIDQAIHLVLLGGAALYLYSYAGG